MSVSTSISSTCSDVYLLRISLYRFTLCRRSFRAWQIAFERSVRHTTRQLRSVQPRGDRSVLRHFFRQWCAFHAGRLEEREIRHRVNSKWAAVQGWMSGV
jgi:hypothetical protein